MADGPPDFVNLGRPARVAILISGRGSNMVALADAVDDPDFPAELALVLSDKPDAAGLALAQNRGIGTCVCDRKQYKTRSAQEAAVDATLKKANIDIICLAGYMRILSADFVEGWPGRLINIHPSLLPAFKGLNTHARALEAGVKTHGCSVHFVTAELDGGPVIAQNEVAVWADDSEDSLARRVLAEEHLLYPRALQMLLDGTAQLVK